MRDIPVLFNNKDECCGCAACYSICPQRAITMSEDEMGFEYPFIDKTKCVCCSICIKTCPVKINAL